MFGLELPRERSVCAYQWGVTTNIMRVLQFKNPQHSDLIICKHKPGLFFYIWMWRFLCCCSMTSLLYNAYARSRSLRTAVVQMRLQMGQRGAIRGIHQPHIWSDFFYIYIVSLVTLCSIYTIYLNKLLSNSFRKLLELGFVESTECTSVHICSVFCAYSISLSSMCNDMISSF